MATNGGDEPPILLAVRNLRKYFPVRGGLLSTHIGDVHAVDGISFDVRAGRTVGLVGESGCGKTTTGRVVLRLIEPSSGHVFYRPSAEQFDRLNQLYADLDVAARSGGNGASAPAGVLRELDQIATKSSIFRKRRSQMRTLRGKMQIVFQDPFSSLSPRLTIREIVREPLEIHKAGTRAERNQRVQDLMTSVGLNPEHLWRFPHEFSGGQRQRIGIARALALRPDFVVLDEPTSALDVSVQAQILNILKRLQQEENLAYLFISHHLSVVRAMAHDVVVMYLGQVVERAPTEELFTRPLHPYTQALLASIPIPDPTVKRERIVLSGEVPSPVAPPSGCRFHTRCPAVMPVCRRVEPRLQPSPQHPGHFVSCHLYHTPDEPADAPLGSGALAVPPAAS
ncbi:MAG TPA: oligopeptide/dipeptide ABC transporter ATP-binding protein [Thermoplasmata archaeon]|nr:oligopeptide/dipeptide ABC transporter ATP-binding protein [Thermoplasmata archaeon]